MARIRLLTILAGLSACDPYGVPNPAADTTADAKLARFASCDELRDWVADAWTEQLLGYAYGYGYGGWPAEDTGDVDEGAGTGRDYSETNVQEAGVDEPDVVKTDGEAIYMAQWNGELTVVDAWPPQDTAVVAHLPLDGQPMSLLLDGSRALVFSSVWDEWGTEDWRWGYVSRASVVDLADPSAPIELRQIDVEGWLVDARRIDGDVYAVVQSYVSLPEDVWRLLETLDLPTMDWDAPAPEQEATIAEARQLIGQHVHGIVDALAIDELIPRAWDHRPDEVVDPEPLLACSDIYHPTELSEPSLLSVVHLDMRVEDGPISATGLLASGWIVYASAENLYVAQPSGSWWGWEESWTSTTWVHQFSLGGADTVYEASGEVDGQVPNRWSMDEFDGYLRVATTDWGWGGTEQAGNNVFVLAQQGEMLDVVGELRGLAPGETIQGVRFLDDYGFVVTFEQIDPLFTIDLRVPTAPTLVGELEVPGYSAYLHPLDGDRLLAVGLDGDRMGTITGFQMSLYDVADLAAPQQLDRLALGTDDGSWSESLWDAHAFTYFNGIASVPVYTYDWNGTSYDGFSGMWVVEVGTTELVELGRVDHSELVARSECLYDGLEGDAEVCPDAWWYATMRRSVVIEDWLYSISDYGVVVTLQRVPDVPVAEALFWPDTGPTPYATR